MFDGLPSFVTLAVLIASAALLRSEIRRRLLGQRRIEVQHERGGVATKFGDDEWHALRHQACDERHVADSRSSLETKTQHLAALAAARAAAS